jgi:hypothetical protein
MTPRSTLRVEGGGLFAFISTEGSAVEFGTAITTTVGLQSDRRYRYRVTRRGRFIAGPAARSGPCRHPLR